MSLPKLVRSRPNRTCGAAAPKRPRGARPVRRVWLGVEELEPRILLAGAAFRLPVLPPASAPFHVVGHSRRAAGAAELGGLFQVPGQPGQSVAVRCSYTLRDAAFRNELGMFLVDDAQGHIGRLKPGDPGYAAAALSRARGLVLSSRGQDPGASRTLELPAGQFFGLYLIQNATTAQFLAHNRRNRPGRGPVAFFSLVRANPDRFQHLRGLPGFRFGFEDGLGGGDRDFNDLVTRVEFGPPQGIAAPPPGPPSPMTAPSPAPAKARIPPGITAGLSDDTAPGGTTNADGVTSDPAVAGTVTAAAAVTSLRAGFDAAPAAAFVEVTAALQPGGAFALNGALLTQLGGGSLPDGRHTLHLSVTDADGGTGTFDLPFTLDTNPPAVDFHLDPAFDTPPVGDGHTQEAVVTLAGTTEPNTAVVLQETGARTTSDPTTGAFSFPGVALTPGNNAFTVQAADQAGNAGIARHTITRDAALVGTTLVEGSRFLTPLEQTVVVPAQPSKLEFRFSNLNFDTRADFIKDAFEASLTDANGNPLVLPVAGTRDAFLNITEGQAPVLSPNAQLTGDTVDVDLSHIPAGTQARLRVRLVNNDADTTTSVLVGEAQVIAAAMDTPGAVTPAAAAAVAPSAVDFSALSDVTASMTATYGQTSLDEKSAVLYAGLTLKNTGGYPVDAPLVAAIAHLSDPSVRVRGDGTTPDGLPHLITPTTSPLPILGARLDASPRYGAPAALRRHRDCPRCGLESQQQSAGRGTAGGLRRAQRKRRWPVPQATPSTRRYARTVRRIRGTPI